VLSSGESNIAKRQAFMLEQDDMQGLPFGAVRFAMELT
jgi:hypothetical protein